MTICWERVILLSVHSCCFYFMPSRCMWSKKISNDQELIQSDPTSCPQNQKGNNEIHKLTAVYRTEKRQPTYFKRPLPCRMPVSGIESVPQQLHARTQGCANYELSDTDHCFLGNILISKYKRGSFHTHKHTWNRDWLDLNVNVAGSAREHTNTHTCQTLIRLGGCPGWSQSSLGAEVVLLVWSYHQRLIQQI